MDGATNDRFTAFLREAARRAEAEIKYRPTDFYKMLNATGGYETALALLNPVKPVSDGFTRLWEEGRLDLSVEALILSNREWAQHFPAPHLEAARKRLKDARFALSDEAAPNVSAVQQSPEAAPRQTVWRVTGPPENFITALTRGFWAFNVEHESTWNRLEKGDILLLHSTRNSAYAEDARSTIIGYARVGGEKFRKNGFWWIQEVEEKQNKWPFAFSLDGICLFANSAGKIDTTRPMEQKTLVERIAEATALSHSGLEIRVLNERARVIDSTAPQFPVTGSVSRVNQVYEELVLSAPDDGWIFVGKEETAEEAEADLLSKIEQDEIDNAPVDRVRAAAEAFRNPGDQPPQYGMQRLRKENAAQKRRVARLENYSCQVCRFCYEYKNAKGQRRWIIHVDHIVDKAAGGGEEIRNLWVLCPNCHTKKTYGVIKVDLVTKTVTLADVRIEIVDNHLFK